MSHTYLMKVAISFRSLLSFSTVACPALLKWIDHPTGSKYCSRFESNYFSSYDIPLTYNFVI